VQYKYWYLQQISLRRIARQKGPAECGRAVVSVYSSGTVGRLVPDEVAGLVRYVREHTPASA
jgi:hypothetical protein